MHISFYDLTHGPDVLARHEKDLQASIKTLLDPSIQGGWNAGDHERASNTIANLRAQIKWVEGQRLFSLRAGVEVA